MKKQVKRFTKFISILSFMSFLPMVAFAANGLTDIIVKINSLLGSILPVIVSLGVVYFVWGMVQYFIADGEEAKKTGKDRIIYAIIGLTVIISIWGLVDILVQTFNLSSSVPAGININGTAGGGCSVGTTFQNLLGFVTCIINDSVIPLIFAVAVVMFIWGVVKFFIIDADEEAKRAQGKQFMIWGIVALAVMISVWGLVTIFGNTFGLNSTILPLTCPPGVACPR